jgi:hypothetical protein
MEVLHLVQVMKISRPCSLGRMGWKVSKEEEARARYVQRSS